MLSFSEFLAEETLNERYLSIGFNKSHEHHREAHRQEIHDILRKSYSHPTIGGYGGHASGSKEESDSIHHDITHSNIKAVKRNGHVTAVQLYKDQHGRKGIAMGTDGSMRGKLDWRGITKDDHKEKRAWAEVSGAPEHTYIKMGYPKVSNTHAAKLTGKKDVRPHPTDPHKYTRKIGAGDHEKVIMGHPKV
jgi:hypothetical protein